MTFGSSPFGSAAVGAKIGSHIQFLSQLNIFTNVNAFYNEILSVFHRHVAKPTITIDSPDVVFDVTSPTIEATIW